MNWSKNKYLNQLWVSEYFSIDRFNEIYRAIRYSSKSFTSNEKEDKYKDFLHAIIVNSNKLYQSSNQKSIDESMVKFQGRAKHLIYIKNKPIKWGFKMFVLCDSIKGYSLNILPHIGETKFTINYIISILYSKLNLMIFYIWTDIIRI